MRPTGIVLIAIYHFLAAAVMVVTPILGVGLWLLVGGDPFAGHRLFFGLLGVVASTLPFATVAALAGYGVWTLREWGRVLCMVLAGISLVTLILGLLLSGFHFRFFLDGLRVAGIAISVLIIWYLLQPQIRSLFQRGVSAPPRI